MGHNLGSRHTHWCGWPGGAIDNCQNVEPDNFGFYCSPGPFPSNGGTIMSYCGATYGPFPLSNGFGYYPNQEITSDIAAADQCICSGVGISESQIEEIILQAVPNPVISTFSIQDQLTGQTIQADLVRIYDLYGKLISEHYNQSEVVLQEVESGTYFVQVHYNEVAYLLRIVK
jgi:hypothetical protein